MRQSGNYWVKLNEFRDWEVAYWDEIGCWLFPGFTSQVKHVFEIDERRIERQVTMTGEVNIKGEDLIAKYPE